MRSAGVGNHTDGYAHAHSAFGIVWLLSLFFFVSSCRPGNAPGPADSQNTPINRESLSSYPSKLPPRREKIWTDFSGPQALAEARVLADFGPRPAGTDPNNLARQHLVDRLTKLGWQTAEQRFNAHTPDGRDAQFCNLIVIFEAPTEITAVSFPPISQRSIAFYFVEGRDKTTILCHGSS